MSDVVVCVARQCENQLVAKRISNAPVVNSLAMMKFLGLLRCFARHGLHNKDVVMTHSIAINFRRVEIIFHYQGLVSASLGKMKIKVH